MKKSTLNAIMTGVIIVLLIGISVVSVKLLIRGHVDVSSEPDTEDVGNPNILPGDVSTSEVLTSEEEEIVVEIVNRVRITGDNINVRSGPGTEYERLGSAYFGYTFELVSEGDEWTKITYDGKEAYVYNTYIEIVPMVLGENGEYTDYVGSDAPIVKPTPSEEAENNIEETDDTGNETEPEAEPEQGNVIEVPEI